MALARVLCKANANSEEWSNSRTGAWLIAVDGGGWLGVQVVL